MGAGAQEHWRSLMTDPFLCVKGSHGSIFAMGDAATIAQAGHPHSPFMSECECLEAHQHCQHDVLQPGSMAGGSYSVSTLRTPACSLPTTVRPAAWPSLQGWYGQPSP